MGKYSGKVLTVYISPHGVRVCEGENRNGDPDITKFFVVHGVESYFTAEIGGAIPEITNMSGLVGAIVDECRQRHTLAKRVMICSECFGIDTQVIIGGPGGAKSLMSGDVKSLFSSLRPTVDDTPSDKMICKVKWGQTAQDGQIHNVSTKSIGDKYMLKSLVTEFFRHGYEVIFVSGVAEVLTNLWQLEPASFDSQGKVVLHVDVAVRNVTFVKDVPVEYGTTTLLDKSGLPDRLRSIVKACGQKTGRNPIIYVSGDMFGDVSYYKYVMNMLEEEGYRVYDLFNCPDLDENYEDKVANGEMDPVLTADFTPNIAMLMCGFTKNLITLTPSVEFGEVFQKNSKAIAVLALAASSVIFVVSLGMSGYRLYRLYDMGQNPSNLDALQNQVAMLTSRQTSLNSTIATLTQADTTVLELLRFIDTNQNDRVHVVSLDTRDMLPDELNVDVGVDASADVGADMTVTTEGEETDVLAGSVGGGGARESIVIRGYAKTGNEAVSYYNRLFNFGLATDPILNGVERYTLPDGDEVYIFEIEIGGGE